ncbi:MAG: hypothetical protein K8S16_02900 [Bacteroidales bacterium]|nr:hypothetical protein [Bacteroidales bacterium]
MKQLFRIALFCLVSSFVFSQNNASSWPDDTLELSEPILDKVFPGVRFYLPPAWPGLGYEMKIHGEYEDTTYLFINYHRFDFNTLFERVKNEANCTLEDRIRALLFLHTYVDENYVYSDIGIRKYEEYKFNIEQLIEEKNNFRDDEFNWYAKCNSQKGDLEFYIKYCDSKYCEDKIIGLYVVYNGQTIDGHINGIFSGIN